MTEQWAATPLNNKVERQSASEDWREPKLSRTIDIEVPLALLNFKGLVPVVLLSILAQSGVTGLIAHRYHDPNIWKIVAAMLLFSACRLGVVLSFNKNNLTQASAIRWQRVYALTLLPYCGAMCFSTFYNFSHHDQTAKTLCTFGVLALCSGLSARVGTRPWAMQISGIAMLATLALCIARSSDPTLALGGLVVICIFGAIHVESIRGKYESTVTQLRDQHKLRELSERDTLTGLANRRYFQEQLNQLCREQNVFATLSLDLDRFKAVNDTHGHAAGDELLRQVALRLKQAIRSTDLLARLGGDEFAILQTPVDSRIEVESLAKRLNESIGRVFIVNDHEVSIGTSIGIEFSRDQEREPGRLLRAADGALYQVKQMGRGGYRFA